VGTREEEGNNNVDTTDMGCGSHISKHEGYMRRRWEGKWGTPGGDRGQDWSGNKNKRMAHIGGSAQLWASWRILPRGSGHWMSGWEGCASKGREERKRESALQVWSRVLLSW